MAKEVGTFPLTILCASPGILKGVFLVRGKCITDSMAITTSYSPTKYDEKYCIVSQIALFPTDPVYAVMKTIVEGAARVAMTWQEAHG